MRGIETRADGETQQQLISGFGYAFQITMCRMVIGDGVWRRSNRTGMRKSAIVDKTQHFKFFKISLQSLFSCSRTYFEFRRSHKLVLHDLCLS